MRWRGGYGVDRRRGCVSTSLEMYSAVAGEVSADCTVQPGVDLDVVDDDKGGSCGPPQQRRCMSQCSISPARLVPHFDFPPNFDYWIYQILFIYFSLLLISLRFYFALEHEEAHVTNPLILSPWYNLFLRDFIMYR